MVLRGLRPIVPVLAVLIWLPACAQRGMLSIDPEAGDVGQVRTILTATSRSAAAWPELFSEGRSGTLSFGRFDVAVPPEREPGTVNFPTSTPPDPATDFVTVSARQLRDERAFAGAVDARLAPMPPGDREVLVFMHGFNTNFAEGLYRQAQMAEDFGMPGVSVHYSWPSAGNVRAYAYDRESALFARDGLEDLLDALAATSADRIVVAAHSMGALVLADTLRQMAIRRSGALDKLQAAVLLSPDLDIDVFRTQMTPLQAFGMPTYVFVSTRDRALAFSAVLRGRRGDRLGSIRDRSLVAGLPVTVIDVSNVGSGADALGHFTVATSPSMIAFIGGMNRIGGTVLQDQLVNPTLFEASVTVFQGATEIVLDPLTR